VNISEQSIAHVIFNEIDFDIVFEQFLANFPYYEGFSNLPRTFDDEDFV